VGIAVLVFGLLVGIFHFQGNNAEPEQQLTLSAEPPVPANYAAAAPIVKQTKTVAAVVVTPVALSPYAALAASENIAQLAQTVADLTAAQPAAVATIISLVPEQAHDIGMVVGAVIGNDADALGMVAQTVAISVGQETFSSLSEGSGVSMSALMKRSSNLGIQVPFDVPNYAAQFAPSPSMVADSTADDNAGS